MAPAVVKERSSYGVSATPVILIAHLFAITVAVLMLFWIFNLRHGISLSSNSLQRLFDAHILFMLFGLVLCGGEAIMAFRVLPGKRKFRKMGHMLINLVGLIFSGLGIFAVFKYFMEEGIPHMHRLHAWIGMGAICLFALQFLIGFAFFFFPGAPTSMRAKLKPWHVVLGLVIYFLSICSALTGLAERSMSLKLHGNEALLVNFAGVGIILYAIAVILTITLP